MLAQPQPLPQPLPLHLCSHSRGYTCGNCGKHWNKESREKRHNKASCPFAKGQFGTIKTKTKTKAKNADIPFVFREGDICTICQDSEDLDFRLSGCGHAFHKECLTPWVNQFAAKTKEPNCPNCRKGICINECKRLGAKVKPAALRGFRERQIREQLAMRQRIQQLQQQRALQRARIRAQLEFELSQIHQLFRNNIIDRERYQELIDSTYANFANFAN